MNAFEWKEWNSGKLPELERHSEAKLSVLRNYVTQSPDTNVLLFQHGFDDGRIGFGRR